MVKSVAPTATSISRAAPGMAPDQGLWNKPRINRPASSQTSRKSATTTTLTRLLCVIWWYIELLSRRHGGVLGQLSARREHRPAGPDRGPDQAVGERRVLLGVVLVVEGPHGRVELVEHALGRLPRRRPLEVHRRGAGQVVDLPTAELEPVAEVQVLPVHEVVGIEEP